ncbi:hypothetical protein FF1_022630 [Malus domestica]
MPSGFPLPVDGQVFLLKKPNLENAWCDGRKSMELSRFSCKLLEYFHAKPAVDIAPITLPARPNFTASPSSLQSGAMNRVESNEGFDAEVGPVTT